MDRAEMCGEVLRRMGIKVGEDDPAFLLVELNRLALEEAVSLVVQRLAPLPGTIEQAGLALAKGVANAAARVIDEEFAAARDKIAKEADTARAAAARAISELAQAQRRAHTDKWLALGFLFGSVFLVCGLAAGYAFALAINTSAKPTTSDVRPSAASLRTGPARDIAAPVPANLGGQNQHR
jgi:hypothetical protein